MTPLWMLTSHCVSTVGVQAPASPSQRLSVFTQMLFTYFLLFFLLKGVHTYQLLNCSHFLFSVSITETVTPVIPGNLS